MQHPLMFFCSFAFGDINVDAYHTLGLAIPAVRNKVARLDPANLSSRADDTILRAILVPSVAESLAPELLHGRTILGMHTSLPFAALDLGSPVGKAMNRSVAFRDLNFVNGDIECETADAGGLSCKRELHAALR